MALVPAFPDTPGSKSESRARLTWTSDTDAGWISLHAIVLADEAFESSITDYPLVDGALAAENKIDFPDTLKLRIIQTQTPFEDEVDGEVIPFPAESVPLVLPENPFHARGLLYLTLLTEQGVGAAADAVGSLLGFGGAKPPLAATMTRPPAKDYISELRRELMAARSEGKRIKLEWLGITWKDLYIDSVQISRPKVGKGVFSVSLKQVVTTASGTASIKATPAESRLAAVRSSGGNQPAVEPKPAEAAAIEAQKESVVYAATH